MQKIHFLLIAMVVVAVSSIFAFSPSNAVNKEEIKQNISTTIPDTLSKIFQASCIGCHGEGGNGLAMSRLNFTIWETYSFIKQAKKARAICNALTKGVMPPSYIRESTPQKVPSAAQTDMICKWAAALKK